MLVVSHKEEWGNRVAAGTAGSSVALMRTPARTWTVRSRLRRLAGALSRSHYPGQMKAVLEQTFASLLLASADFYGCSFIRSFVSFPIVLHKIHVRSDLTAEVIRQGRSSIQ